MVKGLMPGLQEMTLILVTLVDVVRGRVMPDGFVEEVKIEKNLRSIPNSSSGS